MTEQTSARPSRARVAGAKTSSTPPAARKVRPPAPAAKPVFSKKTIALVYDFDGTLSPRPMQEYTFLPKIGEDPKAFWTEANTTARAHGADPLITYMHLMYKKAKARGIRIDREDLVRWAVRSNCSPASMSGSARSRTTSPSAPKARASRCATT